MDDIHFQYHVIIHEIRQRVLVRNDAAHLCRGKKYIRRLFLREERLDRLLPGQIQFLVGAGDNIGIALTFQFSYDGGTHHAAMTRDVNLCILFHHGCPSFCSLSPNYSTVRIAFSRFANMRSCFAMISTSCS